MKIGKFSVTGPLGNGANSSVLQIRRMEDAKAYALKVVPIAEEEDKKYLEQAKHEFEIGQKLNHPHILKVLAYEEVKAWFFGKVVKVLVQVGAEVAVGQGLVVVEAMKMENELKSPKAGKVLEVMAKEGQNVEGGFKLVVVE